MLRAFAAAPPWAFATAVVVVGAVGMTVAIAVDVPCGLDCPPDDDVTLRDAITHGTGLSPPVTFFVALPLVGWLAGRPRWVGTVASAVLAAGVVLMVYAWVADTGTIDAARGLHGPAAAGVAVVLLAAVLLLGARAALELRRRTRRAAAAPGERVQ